MQLRWPWYKQILRFLPHREKSRRHRPKFGNPGRKVQRKRSILINTSLDLYEPNIFDPFLSRDSFVGVFMRFPQFLEIFLETVEKRTYVWANIRGLWKFYGDIFILFLKTFFHPNKSFVIIRLLCTGEVGNEFNEPYWRSEVENSAKRIANKKHLILGIKKTGKAARFECENKSYLPGPEAFAYLTAKSAATW